MLSPLMVQHQRHEDPNPEPCVGAGRGESILHPTPRCNHSSALGAGARGCHPGYTTPSLDSGSFASKGGPDISLNALWRWKCSFHCFPAHTPPVRSHTCGNQSWEASLTFRAFLTAFSSVGGRGRGRAPEDLQLSVPSSAGLCGVQGLAPTMGRADWVVSRTHTAVEPATGMQEEYFSPAEYHKAKIRNICLSFQ